MSESKRYEVLRVHVEAEILVLREVDPAEVSDMDRFTARHDAAGDAVLDAISTGGLDAYTMDLTPSVFAGPASCAPEGWSEGSLVYHDTGLGDVTVERALELAAVEEGE